MLVLSSLVSWMLTFGQSVTTPQSSPLTDDEKKQVLAQLLMLRDLKIITLPEYAAQISVLKTAVVDKELALQSAIASEREKQKAIETERDVFKAQAEFYANALHAQSKKRSFGCWLKKFFSAGISGCR